METPQSVGILERSYPQTMNESKSAKSTDEITDRRRTVPSKIARRSRKGIGGRKSTITPEVSAKLIVALENGMTLKESLHQAGISDDAYRRKLESSAEFRGQIEGAKMKLAMLARSKLAMSIAAGDMPTVRWYLERKVPEEFRLSHVDEDLPVVGNVTVIVPGGKHPRFTPEE